MYQDPTDLHRAREVGSLAAPEFRAWLAFQEAVDREDGAIPRRYRELISVAVALATQCPYCLDVHTAAAREHGVTPEEITEAIFVAGAVKAGGTLAHGLLAMKLYEGHAVGEATPAGQAPGDVT